MSYPYWPNGSLVGYQTLSYNSNTNVLTITPAGNSVLLDNDINTDNLVINPDDGALWINSNASISFNPGPGPGYTSNTYSLSYANFTGYDGSNSGVVFSRFGQSGGAFEVGTLYLYGSGGDFTTNNVPAIDASGGVIDFKADSLSLNGVALAIPPAPRYFNWSANCPGGGMVITNTIFDITQNISVDSSHLYRVSFEVAIGQASTDGGLFSIYTDTSPIVYASVIKSVDVANALDFRQSFSLIVKPSDSNMKLIIQSTSANSANLNFGSGILIEDLGVQPTIPTG